MNRVPSAILITGATSGMGRALAINYAARGVVLCLQGRDEIRMDTLAIICRARGAIVETALFDVRDRERLVAWVRETEARHALDLVAICAGININIGPEGAGEKWDEVEALININITAAMATVDAIVPSMRARRTGQIALFSSLAAYHGLPITPAYSASKAAMRAYGQALRGWLAPSGVWVNVIMPGFVDSHMCGEFPGAKPFRWTAERAAKHIARALSHNVANVSFPFPLNFGSWYLSTLPQVIAEKLIRLFNYTSHRG